jgi:hypothetical protein
MPAQSSSINHLPRDVIKNPSQSAYVINGTEVQAKFTILSVNFHPGSAALWEAESSFCLIILQDTTHSRKSSSSNFYQINFTMSKQVKFANIKVREYSVTLGDNPSCRSGPPVSLDWDYKEDNSVALSEYEQQRAPRRKSYQMFMHKNQRKHILENGAGFTPDEIERTTKEMKKIQKQRNVTKALLPFMKVEESATSAGRKVKRIVKT